ncbi:MAG: cytochrome c family protein [Bacteroidetes bacterium]|nr:cytochrome c family protein [Bacteroidota bacterium]
MYRILTNTVLFTLFSISLSFGQLSPGPLSQPHAELEGIRNCTLCHDLGDKVSDQKCLDCHKEIQSLQKEKRGYHANREVTSKNCFDCHSEHHGRKFDMVRFDEDNFNHLLTGYKLEGQHEVVDCRKCHKPDYIADSDLKKNTGTFLGLEQKCATCHVDYHQNTLSQDCAACHNVEAFRPAPGFDHDDADFKLRGAHENVDCAECHQVTTRKGKEFQQFTDIAFKSCVDCHDDAHEGRIFGACTQCHNENSFSNFIGTGRFDHNTTLFTLKGKHKTIDCFSCHAKRTNPLTVFHDKQGISENQCVTCHEDQHKGKYGQDCAKCHQESSFLSLKSMNFFDHNVTDYPLVGQHVSVDCKQCHKKRFSTPIDFSECKNCHEDYHRGEFTEKGRTPDCVECHSLEHGFDYSLYTLEDHQQTDFPLEGAHFATPCFACHVDEKTERWTFRNLGSDCKDCHQDIHRGHITEKYYPRQNCKSCHINEAWSEVNFDHNLTDWPLDGKHKDVTCRECHFEKSHDNTSFLQFFNSLNGKCTTCHENIHGDEFAINGETDCKRCHITESWFPESFDHSQTDFPLDGRHAEVACKACHEKTDEKGQKVVIYQIEKFACIDCHQ